ncbi:transposase [Paraburkholderia sp. UYCP14C]|uniref:transposase n=1 Tax=Paraburkholderia sp. UYCP14C TaxID=2511130 RepID=UPI0010200E28|nr:transposase [Paraburkholderia sp. UYCP14C]RZF26050.1 transposase [Paraburkholderia sp. UYCP14C]
MNRIPKAVYTKEFREEAVKLAMTEGVGVSEAAPQYNALSALNEGLSWREAIHAAMGDGPLTLKRERRSKEEMRGHVASRVREFMDKLK